MKGSVGLAGFGATAMALAMIAAFLLVLGGIKLALKAETRGKGVLMMAAAAVLAGNVVILTI